MSCSAGCLSTRPPSSSESPNASGSTNKPLSEAVELTKNNQAEQASKTIELSLKPVDFSVQPANCIALRHGRTCYANVTLSWASPIKQDYCIYIKQSTSKLLQMQSVKCWKNSNGDQVMYNFESNKKLEFQLMSMTDNQVVAETAVAVSWVHKATPRKRRWRIF